MRTNVTIKLVGLLAATVMVLSGALGSSDPARVFAMAARPPVVGTIAPDFTLPDLEGTPVRLSEYRGRIVLLNFWATWCKPCVKEMPAMQRTYDDLRDQGFVVLAINELEDEARVRDHIAEHGHTFPVVLDHDNRVANMYGVRGLPVSVFVDETGRVRQYVKGGLLTEETIRQAIARIRADAPATAAAGSPS